MTLAAFIKLQQERLADFQAYWKSNMEADPDGFPAEMLESDWLEQLDLFQ